MSAQLRPVETADQAFLFQLFCAIRPELAMLPESLLQMQFRAQTLSYGAKYPGAEHQIVAEEGRPVGHLLVDRSPERIHLVDIALLPEVQGKGIGSELLQALQQEAAASSRPVRLSVYETNPAQWLYARLGFAVTGHDGTRLQMTWNPGGVPCSNP